MAQVSYPGVYIQEVPSGVRTITSVSTSITAFIDFFRQGPVDQAVQIFGMADFDRIYDGLDKDSEASYAISQFFLNGGSEAYVVRVAKGEVLASVTIKADTGAGVNILKIDASNEGAWGNALRVDIDHNTSVPTTLFNLYVTRYTSDANDAQPLASEKYLNLSMDSNSTRYVDTVVNNESKLIGVTVTDPPDLPALPDLPAPTGTVSGDISGLGLVDVSDFNGLTGKKFNVKIGTLGPFPATLELWDITTSGSEAVKTLRDLRPYIEKAIRAADESKRTPFTNAVVEVVADKYLRILAGRGGPDYVPLATLVITAVNSTDPADVAAVLKLTRETADTAAHPQENLQEYPLGISAVTDTAHADGTAGADGELPGPDEIVGSQAEPPTGLYALDKVELFNILCIPRAADLPDPDMNVVVSNALKYCEDRRAFMIMDIPSTINEVQEIKDWMDTHGSVRHKNAAVYFPRPRIPDPRNDYRLRSVSASGTLAGVYARTDSARGVWKTPAGIEAVLVGVSDLDLKLTDAQNGTLNPLGINCLRSFPIYGHIAWGGRTLEGADAQASEWKYLAVRRLALNVEESLFRGTKWAVFEGNDDKLWSKIRLNVGAYMMSLFRQGAFQGTAPAQAFYVKCDKETTTQDDINKGIVNIEVGFAPLKPAEFVVIKIQQMAGDLQ